MVAQANRSGITVSNEDGGEGFATLADCLRAARTPVGDGKDWLDWARLGQGEKIAPLSGIPPVYWQSQNGMLDVFVSPRQATDGSIYLTYIEPGEYGGSQALVRAKLNAGRVLKLQDLQVIWRQMLGQGGQVSGQVAISPDGEYIYMAVDGRQRMTLAQDFNQPLGKIVRLTLDNKPVPSNPKLREDRR